jgi:hypothetical protein
VVRETELWEREESDSWLECDMGYGMVKSILRAGG